MNRFETAPKSPKLLNLQVRRLLRPLQVEPHAASQLQIISASHLHLPRRFPCRSNCRATSQHPETLQTSSLPTNPKEQLSDTEPPSAISNHTSYHFLSLLLPYLPLPVTSTLLLLALLYASWLVRANRARTFWSFMTLLPNNTHTCHALQKTLFITCNTM